MTRQNNGNNGGEQRRPGQYQTLLNRFGERIFEQLQTEEAGREFGEDAETAFKKFASYDPTTEGNGKKYAYLQWLCKKYIDAIDEGNPISVEQLDQISDDIRFFIELKRTRRHDQYEKDINQHTPETLAALREEYTTGEKAKSKSEMMRDLKRAVRRETIVHYEGSEGIIVTPTTARASQHWGQNSTWCVSASRMVSEFSNYNRHGPLVFFLPQDEHDKRKYLGHIRERLRDASQYPMDEIPQPLKRLVNAALLESPDTAYLIVTHGKYPIDEIPSNALKIWRGIIAGANNIGEAQPFLERAPKGIWKDEEFTKQVLKNDPAFFGVIPEKFKTKGIFMIAALLASANNQRLQYHDIMNEVAEEFWADRYFRKTLVMSEPTTLARIPLAYRDENTCLSAIKMVDAGKLGHSGLRAFLGGIPADYWQDEEFCREAATHLPQTRQYMSTAMQAILPRPEQPEQNGLLGTLSSLFGRFGRDNSAVTDTVQTETGNNARPEQPNQGSGPPTPSP